MGYNTVAVLFNDGLHLGVDDPGLGKRIQDAARNWHHRHQDRSWLDISARSPNGGGGSYGSVVSLDHADGYQVVVAHGNMGWRIDNVEYDKYLGWQAFNMMKDCLERNGYRVAKARKPKAPPTPLPDVPAVSGVRE